MSTVTRWVPWPGLTISLAVLWLWLHDSLSAGHILVGLGLGVLTPWLVYRFLPSDSPRVDPGRLTRFLVLVLWDITVASLVVSRQILGPGTHLEPRFVRVPLDVTGDAALTMLAGTVSLTPGTVSAELSVDRAYLLIHCLSAEDEETVVDTVKRRYERRIMEMFR